MLGRALSFYGKHFGAVLLTAAVALVPANLLMAGAVTYGLASMGAGGTAEARTHTQEVREKQRNPEGPAPTPEQSNTRAREALEGGSEFNADPLRYIAPLAYAVVIIVALLSAGLALAHAALVPLVLDLSVGAVTGPGRAWAVVASRFGAVASTTILGIGLVALGSLFCIVPGLVLALGFSFAIPVTLLEGLSGRAALERSWALMKGGRWLPVLLMLVLLALFTAAGSGAALLLPTGPWRIFVSALVRVVGYPLPLIGLVLLYP